MLHKLEPERFQETPDEGCWYESFKVGLLCLAFNVSPDTPLPTTCYEGLETWVAFGTALSQHYNAQGKPLSSDNTEDDLKDGFYKATQNAEQGEWTVTCRLDHRAEKAVLTFAAEDLVFDDPFDINTVASIKKDNRWLKVDDLLDEFVALGVEAPPAAPTWQGAAFAKRKEPHTPKSSPEAKAASKGAKRPSPSPPSGVGVSDALRRRLAVKGTGSAASTGAGR